MPLLALISGTRLVTFELVSGGRWAGIFTNPWQRWLVWFVVAGIINKRRPSGVVEECKKRR